MSQNALFPDADELLISVYAKIGRTLDDLPYTEDFDALWQAAGAGGSKADLFHRLHNLRKAARLPRLGRAVGQPPRIAPEHERLLAGLAAAELGSLSLRDQLPYTDAFERIVTAFNSRAGLSLAPHDVWRIIAKLAK